MKIAYFGYDLFYLCLKKLLLSDDIEVLKIFSFPANEDDKNDKVKSLADEYGIEFTEKKVTKEDLLKLKNDGVDLIVCAGYAYKIPVDSEIKGINMHPALLPEGRGAWPMPVSILKGLTKTGLTVHEIEESFDTGKILKQKEYTLKKDETLESLCEWLLKNSAELMYDCVINYDKYIKTAKEQSGGEYWKMPTEEDMTFDDNTPTETKDRILRAFYGSGCFYKTKTKEIKIKKGKLNQNGELIIIE